MSRLFLSISSRFRFVSSSFTNNKQNNINLVFSINNRKFSSNVKMPPIKHSEVEKKIDEFIKNNQVMIFSKTYCPFCNRVKGLFNNLNTKFFAFELDEIDQDEAKLYQESLKNKTGMGTVPNVFVSGQHIGGCDDTFKAHEENKLKALLGCEAGDSVMDSGFDYDLVVIGGGSGGLSAAKEAANSGRKVALCDFVTPTPIGTSWGLGGTCVNVGCIPKKLMHQASLLGVALEEAKAFGWEFSNERSLNWEKMVEAVQEYIKSLNWGYRLALRDKNVKYLNEYAVLTGEHEIMTKNKKGKTQNITADKILVAVGGRPRYPSIPGAKEFGITSDDLFSLPYNPGKTLCIGASYIALECAGFLAGFGIDTSVMVRSILLRGFDQQMAELIGDSLEDHGVKFWKGWIPTEIIKVKEGSDGKPPTLLVRGKRAGGEEGVFEEEFNTVVFAIGRDPCTDQLQMEKAGVQLIKETGKILTNDADQTNVENIFAIGDVAHERPELTPAAIQAGLLLARRLYKGSNILTDYVNVPTTVFTPIEYGCIGLPEEAAINQYGKDDIEIYHSHFTPLEGSLSKNMDNKCYAKLICVKSKNELVVGFHYFGPNAGEITQGFALGFRLGATKSDYSSIIGIHPTCAEIFTSLSISKSSGISSKKTGC